MDRVVHTFAFGDDLMNAPMLPDGDSWESLPFAKSQLGESAVWDDFPNAHSKCLVFGPPAIPSHAAPVLPRMLWHNQPRSLHSKRALGTGGSKLATQKVHHARRLEDVTTSKLPKLMSNGTN